jgi:hypothetical protein
MAGYSLVVHRSITSLLCGPGAYAATRRRRSESRPTAKKMDFRSAIKGLRILFLMLPLVGLCALQSSAGCWGSNPSPSGTRRCAQFRGRISGLLITLCEDRPGDCRAQGYKPVPQGPISLNGRRSRKAAEKPKTPLPKATPGVSSSGTPNPVTSTEMSVEVSQSNATAEPSSDPVLGMPLLIILLMLALILTLALARDPPGSAGTIKHLRKAQGVLRGWGALAQLINRNFRPQTERSLDSSRPEGKRASSISVDEIRKELRYLVQESSLIPAPGKRRILSILAGQALLDRNFRRALVCRTCAQCFLFGRHDLPNVRRLPMDSFSGQVH